MKIRKRLFWAISILFLIGSCGPSQREKAVEKTNEAKAFITNGDTLQAIEILVSIPRQFPKAKVQIGVSKNLADELYRQLIDNRMAQISSIENTISTLEKNFTKEKTEFDTYVQYIPVNQYFKRSWNKSFLQVNLDERGEIFLTSHYMGKEWLRHTAIRVYDEDIQVKTPEVALDDPNNRKSDFLEYKWEKVSFTEGKSDSIIRFITKNYHRKLKCVYLGSSHYYIILEDYNISAIKEGWELSEAIKRKKQLNSEISELTKKRDAI
jgi:hypothetical protein